MTHLGCLLNETLSGQSMALKVIKKLIVDSDFYIEKTDSCPANDRFKQIISSMSFKFCNNLSPLYMNDVFKLADQPNTTTRASLLKLNQPLRRTNHGQNNISYIAMIIWNNLPNYLKTTDNLDTYKHRVKENFFHRIRNEANNIYSYF